MLSETFYFEKKSLGLVELLYVSAFSVTLCSQKNNAISIVTAVDEGGGVKDYCFK